MQVSYSAHIKLYNSECKLTMTLIDLVLNSSLFHTQKGQKHTHPDFVQENSSIYKYTP